MNNIGFLAALAAAVAWGTYFVPFKKSKSSNIVQFQALMSMGIFLSGLLMVSLLRYQVNFNIYGIISGLIWGLANAISLSAVSNLGLSRATPILSGLVIIGSFLWGALVFNELPSGFLNGFIGIVLIVSGIILVNSNEGSSQSKNIKKGLAFAFIAGLLFSSQLVPLKIANLSPQMSFFPLSFGILLFGVGYAFFKRLKFKNQQAVSFGNEAILSSVISGVIWNIGNLFGISAVSLIGLSKGLPLTQISVLIAVCWGLFYFKEVSSKKKVIKIIIGALVLLSGVVILSLA